MPDPRRLNTDVGAADPGVTAALAAYQNGTGGPSAVLAALVGCRLLVPVVAVLDEAARSADGVPTDKSSHMATVLTTGRDGRRGLLAFTCLESLQRWDRGARPVPAPAPGVAAAAISDGADALVLDLAGPVMFSVEGADLQALADRRIGPP